MARTDLKYYDFIRLISQRSKRSPETVEKVLDAMLDVIYEELRLHGRLRIKNFGLLETKTTGGYEKEFVLPSGQKIVRWVERKEKIGFKASDKMYDNVNAKGLSHDFKKRKKEGRLTSADMELDELYTRNAEHNAQLEILKIIEQKRAKKGQDTNDEEI